MATQIGYIGGFDHVDIPAAGLVNVPRGTIITVSDVIAADLLLDPTGAWAVPVDGVLPSTPTPFTPGPSQAPFPTDLVGLRTVLDPVYAPKTGSGAYVALQPIELQTALPSGGDDTPAITALLAVGVALAVATNGPCQIVMRFAPGTYLINGALVQTSNRNAQIPLPIVALTANKISIRFEAVGARVSSWGNQTVPQGGGVVWLSNLNVGAFDSSKGAASVIGGPAYGCAALANTAQNDFTNLNVTFGDITVRQRANPTAVSVDLSHVAQGGGKLITDTNVGFASVAPCTHPQSCGYIAPQSYNNAHNPIELLTTGNYCNWLPGEHTRGSVTTAFGVIATGCNAMSHFAHLDYLSDEANLHRLAGWDLTAGVVDVGSGQNDNPADLPLGQTFLKIDCWDMEIDGSPWATVDDIKDANNKLIGAGDYGIFPPRGLIATGCNFFLLRNLVNSGLGCSLTNSAPQNVHPTSGDYIFTFDTPIYNPCGLWWAAGDPTMITVPVGMAGFYDLFGNVVLSAGVGVRRQLSFLINGTPIGYCQVPPAVTQVDCCQARADAVYLSDGDYVQLQVLQDSGGGLDDVVVAPRIPCFSVSRRAL